MQGPSSSASDFSDFVEEVFGYLPRVDQRKWADAYLRGLLTVPGKKTIRQMAKAVSLSAGAPQALQQFISASPWHWDEARAALARRVSTQLPIHAWTIGLALTEKRGEHSVGVHRRFDADAGRTLNCQVGIGLFLTSGSESLPIDWRLLMNEEWSEDERRRRRARVPESVRAQPVWAHVLDLVDRLTDLKLSSLAPLIVDRHCATDAGLLAAHLNVRERDFLIEIRADQPIVSALAAGSGPRGPHAGQPVSAQQFLRDGGARYPYVVSVEHNGQVRHLNVFSALVRLPGIRLGAPGAQRVYRLLAERSPGHRGPTRFWITSLVDRRVDEVLSLMRRPALTHATVRRLQDEFGLLDFEGRSFPGWHHHMTLSSAAYAYSRLPHPARRPAAV